MYLLYNIAIYIVAFGLNIIAIFNRKISLFVNGRKSVFKQLKQAFGPNDQVFWFHCASLGEFEQARPLIERLKKNHNEIKILVTFFSPSGYEIRKNYKTADLVTYLPLDTKRNAKRFVKQVRPRVAIFVKYEFWPNMLKTLEKKQVKTILISGIFRESQHFFKPYFTWMRKSLKAFDVLFVQNKRSKNLLKNHGFKDVILTGDTRFDRVYQITQQDNHLEQIARFTKDHTILVAGSTWEKDHQLLINYINNEAQEQQKFIIAPHNINDKEIRQLQQKINKRTVLLLEPLKPENEAQVLIINTIGILTKIYAYAHLAYVGGGFGAGIHNILEPACYGMPIIIGPKYQKFNEAIELVDLQAATVVNDQDEFNNILNTLFKNNTLRQEKATLSKGYIQSNLGATDIILNYLEPFILKK